MDKKRNNQKKGRSIGCSVPAATNDSSPADEEGQHSVTTSTNQNEIVKRKKKKRSRPREKTVAEVAERSSGGDVQAREVAQNSLASPDPDTTISKRQKKRSQRGTKTIVAEVGQTSGDGDVLREEPKKVSLGPAPKKTKKRKTKRSPRNAKTASTVQIQKASRSDKECLEAAGETDKHVPGERKTSRGDKELQKAGGGTAALETGGAPTSRSHKVRGGSTPVAGGAIETARGGKTLLNTGGGSTLRALTIRGPLGEEAPPTGAPLSLVHATPVDEDIEAAVPIDDDELDSKKDSSKSCFYHRCWWLSLVAFVLISCAIIGGIVAAQNAGKNLRTTIPLDEGGTIIRDRQWTLVASVSGDESSRENFGTSVALSLDGSRVAIGARRSSLGLVRIYDLVDASLQQVGYALEGEDTDSLGGNSFGHSVALSSDGSRLAVSDLLSSGNGFNSGLTRIFDMDGSSWQQVGSDMYGTGEGDAFGHSFAFSSDGSRVAIGTPLPNSKSGHVRIYDLVGSSWQQIGPDLNGDRAGDGMGHSVSLSSDGRRVAVGGTGNDDNGSNSGYVRIYDLVGSSWQQVGSDLDGEVTDMILDSDVATYTVFGNVHGRSVSLSSDGNRVAIGARLIGGNGNTMGHARVYDLVGSSWQQVGSTLAGAEPEDDLYGYTVALSADGSRMVLSATPSAPNSGYVRVYDLVDSSWQQVGSDLEGEGMEYNFGERPFALSSDGKRLAVSVNSLPDGISNDARKVGTVLLFELE